MGVEWGMDLGGDGEMDDQKTKYKILKEFIKIIIINPH